MQIRVTPFRGLAGLQDLEQAWRHLVSNPTDPYYLDYDWYAAFCRHAFGQQNDVDVWFFLAQRSGHPVAIIPLEYRVERIRRVPTRIWSLVGARISDIFITSAAADFPATDDQDAAVSLDAVRKFLGRFRPRASLLLIGRTLESSKAGVAAKSLSSCRVHEYSRDGVDVIETPASFDALLSRLTGKFRRNLRSRFRALSAEGRISFIRYKQDDRQFDEAFSELLDVEASGWKGAAGTRTALNQNLPQRSLLIDVNRNEGNVSAEIYLLHLDSRCIAAQYWLRTPNGLANLKMGYDESMRRFSPGHQLLAHVLERACEDRSLSEVSLVSHQPWHADWRPVVLPHHWSYFHLGTPWSRFRSMLFSLPTRAALRA